MRSGALVACVVAVGTALVSRVMTMNAYFALFAGRYIVQHGLPHHNVFTTVNAGRDWVDQQWLAHVLFYEVWSAGGYRTLTILNILLVSAGVTGVLAILVRRGVAPGRAAAWSLLAYAGAFSSSEVRPQSFAFALFPLLLWLLLDDADAPVLQRRTLVVVPLLVLWANLHGSALMAAALVALYGGYRAIRSRPHLILAVAAPLALVMTPYGVGGLRYYASVLGNSSLQRNLPQWGRPSLANPGSWPFFLVAAVVVTAIVVARRRGSRVPVVPVALTAVLFVQATRGDRFAVWFAMTGAIAAALALEPVLRDRPHRDVRFVRLAVSTILALVAIVVMSASPDELVPRRAVDIAAATAGPGSRILGDETTGTPLLWLHPELAGRVAYDVRFEQYTPAQIDRYFEFLRYADPIDGFDVVVVDRRAHPQLAAAMLDRSDWRAVYDGRDGVVTVRR